MRDGMWGGSMKAGMFPRVGLCLGLVCCLGLWSVSGHASPVEGPRGVIQSMVDGAYAEVAKGTRYNTAMLDRYFAPSYVDGVDTGTAVYPNGDVAPGEGVCADLVVRALRRGGLDLQVLVHQDVRLSKEAYGVRSPDRFSDHRRVWILKTYFKRHWQALPAKGEPSQWQAGDVVIWRTGSKKHLHIGMVGRNKRPDGFPHVIHNMRRVPFISPGKTVEEDSLWGSSLLAALGRPWTVIGHYRFKGPTQK